MNALIENAKNVIFDIGQVLLSFEPEVFLPKVLSPEAAKVLNKKNLFGMPEWGMVDEGILGEAACAHILTGLAGHPEFEEEALRAYREFPVYMSVLPAVGMFDYLHAAGKKIYALSNYGTDGFNRTLARFPQVFEKLDGYVISGREKTLKPRDDFYQLILNRYQLRPEECVFIDDVEANIAGAARNGIPGIVYRGAESLL